MGYCVNIPEKFQSVLKDKREVSSCEPCIVQISGISACKTTQLMLDLLP